MRAYVGVTDDAWYRFLGDRPEIREINFWRPSPNPPPNALVRGDLFLFKSKKPHHRIVGRAFFAEYLELPLSVAWETFAEGNGAADGDAMRASIAKYRRKNGSPIRLGEDPKIGCIVLTEPAFFPEEDTLRPPVDWSDSIVQGKTYTSEKPEHQSFLEELLAGITATALPPTPTEPWTHDDSAGPSYRVSKARPPGQGAFQARILQNYQERCAITGSTIRPALQAAHIVPVESRGEYRSDNGILLRADLHVLFDRGFIGVDTDYRVQVSPQLAARFPSVERHHERVGQSIHLPKQHGDRPKREFLEWHLDKVFLGS